MNIENELEKELRKIYDDDEFVFCTFGMVKSQNKKEKMLAFIRSEKVYGNKTEYEDIIKLSLLLYDEPETK